jgi:lysophospholipase L1-like esterase
MSVRILLAAVSLSVLAACGSGPTPPPPPPAAPSILCPVSQSVDAPQNVPVPVNFVVPSGSGGQPPLTVTCTAQPNSNFSLGSTLVTCTVRDALQRQASCNFNVTVVPTPVIAKTSFLAFGDSITHGTKTDPVAETWSQPRHRPFSLGEAHSYPYKLHSMLTGRYTSQSLSVNNVGVGGETASRALSPEGSEAGEDRIRRELLDYQPAVVLLMEGTNDLFFSQDLDPPHGIPDIIAALDRMISDADATGTQVLLATVPPQRLGTNRDKVAQIIPQLNAEIRNLALQRNVLLVDVYAALATNMNLYIGDDHLHPTEQGMQRIADTFFEAIRATFDITPAGYPAR